MAISKDGRFLYVVGSGAREISVFSIGADRMLSELPEGKSPLRLGISSGLPQIRRGRAWKPVRRAAHAHRRRVHAPRPDGI